MRTLFIILLLFCFYGHEVQGTLRPVKKSSQQYLLPKKHPLNSKLRRLFVDPKMFESEQSLIDAGFTLMSGHRHLLVGEHPSIKGYLIKKFTSKVSSSSQVHNYLKRINGAITLKNYFKEKGYNHLVVPNKWIYELPASFSLDGQTKAYLLVVTNMDAVSEEETRRQYYEMDRTTLKELCHTIHRFGCDPKPENQPFTRSGKIAFVDTEYIGGGEGEWFRQRIVAALNEENQKYALDLWERLEKP